MCSTIRTPDSLMIVAKITSALLPREQEQPQSKEGGEIKQSQYSACIDQLYCTTITRKRVIPLIWNVTLCLLLWSET